MSEESSKLAMTKSILAGVGSVAATAMFARSVLREILPNEFQVYFCSGVRSFLSRFSNDFTMVIREFDKLDTNEIYEAAEIYLGDMVDSSTRRLQISKAVKEKSFNVRMEKDDAVVDEFNGVKLRWHWFVNKAETPRNFYNSRSRTFITRAERCFHLTFHKKYKDMVIDSYLPFLLNQAKLKEHEKRTLKLFTVDPEEMYDASRAWVDITLDHPANFDTLAMDSELKDMILKDLDRFVKRRDYYRQVGKAWKRGYLLYGPPGTGKSSLIAAMANYLNFDIYDLDLSAVKLNSDLRKLLVATANKSILVVEDIDCTVELKERATVKPTANSEKSEKEESQVTLSGFLNFIDGLWSSCGDERVIIFTTNHKEKLDPALLRPGRMDVHIHMSYCTPSGFRILAINYLGLKDHPLFEDIEGLIETTEVTPAEMAEQLLHHDEVEATLKGLIGFIHKKKKEKEKEEEEEEEEAKAKKDKEVNAAAAGEKKGINVKKGVDDHDGVKKKEAEEKVGDEESMKVVA